VPVKKPATKPKSKLTPAQQRAQDAKDKRVALMALFKNGENLYCTSQIHPSCKADFGVRKADMFYLSNSDIYPTGKLAICKECMVAYVTNENATLNKPKFIRLLAAIDRPYLDDLFESASARFVDANGDYDTRVVSEYVRLCNNKAYIDKNFSHSDSSYTTMVDEARAESDPFNIIVTNALRAEWGLWIKEDTDIKFLEYTFRKYVSFYSINTEDPVQVALVRDICFQDLKLQKARESNSSEKDILAAKQALLNTANLTPTQTAKSNVGFTLGGFIKLIEEDEPIPEPSEEFKDPDRIYEIFMKFFGHILAMMGKTNHG